MGIIEFIKKYKKLKTENEELKDKILKAKKELRFMKDIAEMNQYGSTKVILSNVVRKIKKIEEIFEND